MVKIIIDTNFLMLPALNNVDLTEMASLVQGFEGYIVLTGTIEELNRLTKTGKMQDRMAAKVGLQIAEKMNCEKIKSNEHVDDFIDHLADNNSVIVATQDAQLRQRLRKKGVSSIVFRSKKHLELVLA